MVCVCGCDGLCCYFGVLIMVFEVILMEFEFMILGLVNYCLYVWFYEGFYSWFCKFVMLNWFGVYYFCWILFGKGLFIMYVWVFYGCSFLGGVFINESGKLYEFVCFVVLCVFDRLCGLWMLWIVFDVRVRCCYECISVGF